MGAAVSVVLRCRQGLRVLWSRTPELLGEAQPRAACVLAQAQARARSIEHAGHRAWALAGIATELAKRERAAPTP
ncbi:MAG: hypothetical protein KatS3mg131_2094 [Candidatus Tectimicrobiota bacterium]|nr:MAG: hypothetical protein KatS3mg131_2094 [Candidatus Tectomicrobia bacterium]